MQVIENVIGGVRARSASSRTAPVFNPATGEQSAILPLSTAAELDAAVAAAKRALPAGGRYDGVLGVVSGGLELVRTLSDLEHTTRRPIVVINWNNEEGARFASDAGVTRVRWHP